MDRDFGQVVTSVHVPAVAEASGARRSQLRVDESALSFALEEGLSNARKNRLPGRCVG